MRNKLIKALAAATFAVVGMGVTGTVNSSNTAVQASTFHYLRKDHKFVTLGLGQNLPVREYNHGIIKDLNINETQKENVRAFNNLVEKHKTNTNNESNQ